MQSCAFPDDRRLVLVESAIDALSFHQLAPDPHTRYASTAGSLSDHQRALLGETLGTLPVGTVIALSFDRDAAGEKLADEVRSLRAAKCSRLCSPIGKDWNDCLQEHERDYIRTFRQARGLSRAR